MGGTGGASGQSSTPFQKICPVTVMGKCRVLSVSTPAMLIDVPRHLLRVNTPLALGVIEGGRRYSDFRDRLSVAGRVNGPVEASV
jgi:N-acyl-L-homoserine lactone synthetase